MQRYTSNIAKSPI